MNLKKYILEILKFLYMSYEFYEISSVMRWSNLQQKYNISYHKKINNILKCKYIIGIKF